MFFDHQVAGHKEQLLYYPEDNSKLIKYCNKTEIEFYRKVRKENMPLLSFLPELYEYSDDQIVIRNLTTGFTRPNVIDIKLGTVLHDQLASELKMQRMKSVAETTTSGSLGFRICGMKVFDLTKHEYIIFDAKYGRSLDDVSVSSGFSSYLAYSSRDNLSAIKAQLIDLKLAYEKSNVVLISASLLIVYEGSSVTGQAPIVNLIDFAHSRTLSSDIEKKELIQEREGVLLGLENITSVITSIKIP